MKVHVTKSYLDMARCVIDTKVYGDKNQQTDEDFIYSLMSCTYTYSYMAMSSFTAEQLYEIWNEKNSGLKNKFNKHESFESLMLAELKELKDAFKELAIQKNIDPPHKAIPKEWQNLNDFLKKYRHYFVHPNPNYFSEYIDKVINLPWAFPTTVATEIIKYYYEATGSLIPNWLYKSSVKSRGFDIISI